MTNLYCNGRKMVPYEYMRFFDELEQAPAEAKPEEDISKMSPMDAEQ